MPVVPVGNGKKVGVAGREVGVGIEVVVAVLPPDNRDCGRLILVLPVLIVLWKRGLAFDDPKVGEEEVDAAGRNVLFGLEPLRRSFGGEGESSIMSTQPEVSPAEPFLLFSDSVSVLRLESELRLFDRGFSQLVRLSTLREPDGGVGLPRLDAARAFAFCRPDMLPIRNLGTRV